MTMIHNEKIRPIDPSHAVLSFFNKMTFDQHKDNHTVNPWTNAAMPSVKIGDFSPATRWSAVLPLPRWENGSNRVLRGSSGISALAGGEVSR